jgi:hypothetical protein
LATFFGFKQNDCAGESVMSDTTLGSYRPNFTACDGQNLNAFRPVVRRDNDQDGYSPEEGDCNDTIWDMHPNALISCQGNPYGAEDMNCNGVRDWDELCCTCDSPVIIDVNGDGITLTNRANGVPFDLNRDGVAEQLPWTAAGSDDAWLVLDRNYNGWIDNGGELFGNFTDQPVSATPNGFIALAEYDQSLTGGNHDGWIDEADAIYPQLRLWRDVNHDGISQPAELLELTARGVSGRC